jgi:hypothetical protein
MACDRNKTSAPSCRKRFSLESESKGPETRSISGFLLVWWTVFLSVGRFTCRLLYGAKWRVVGCLLCLLAQRYTHCSSSSRILRPQMMEMKVGCSTDHIKQPITVVPYFSRCSIDTGTLYAAPGQPRGMKLAEPPFSGHMDYD